MSATQTLNPTRDMFAEMLEASLVERKDFEETVVQGIVTAIEKDVAVIDVGLKTEGRVPLKEFAQPGKQAELKVGDTVEVYV
ncbi:MAG: S1 RNA-binding domain-containing protein, partial [Amphiplicatus sp.]